MRWINHAVKQLSELGSCKFSRLYEIPCRDGKGDDYYNLAAVLQCGLTLEQLNEWIKQQELAAVRVRPSHQISLDIDVIAWGESLQQMQVVAKKLPLPFDVSKPLAELWPECPAYSRQMSFKIIVEALK
jgi:2-amino-4-hydroxy-6-hydroxymethyldihydropteridine diphosphokinase